MEPRHARLSVEGCHVTPEGAAKLMQQLGERMSWQIDVMLHLHSTESFTLTYVPPEQYWLNQVMFKELTNRVMYHLTEGSILEETAEDTEVFKTGRNQCKPELVTDTAMQQKRL